MVTGTSGADQHNFTGQAPFMEKQFKRFGFLDVQVIDNGTRMICTFYEMETVPIRINLLLQNQNYHQSLNRWFDTPA